MAGANLLIHCGLDGVSGAQCRLAGTTISLERCLAEAGEQGVTLLLDGRDLLLTVADLPTRSRRKAQAAAPFAIEEQVAGDLETQHIALGPRIGNRYPVAVVARQRFEALLDELARLGFPIERVVPDILALPHEEHRWTLGETRGALLVRCGPAAGFACDLDVAETLLAAAVAAETTTPGMLAVGRFERFDCAAWCSARGIDLVRRDQQTPLLELFSPQPNPAIDLLPEELRRREGRQQPRVRAALLLLVITALLHLTNLYLDRRDLNREAEALRESLEASFLAVAPPGAPVRDPLAQLETLAQQVERGPGQPDLLALLTDLTTALEQGEVGNLTLSAVRFRNGETELTMTGGSAGQVENLARTLANLGRFRARVLSAATVGTVIEARLLVTLP